MGAENAGGDGERGGVAVHAHQKGLPLQAGEDGGAVAAGTHRQVENAGAGRWIEKAQQLLREDRNVSRLPVGGQAPFLSGIKTSISFPTTFNDFTIC